MSKTLQEARPARARRQDELFVWAVALATVGALLWAAASGVDLLSFAMAALLLVLGGTLALFTLAFVLHALRGR